MRSHRALAVIMKQLDFFEVTRICAWGVTEYHLCYPSTELATILRKDILNDVSVHSPQTSTNGRGSWQIQVGETKKTSGDPSPNTQLPNELAVPVLKTFVRFSSRENNSNEDLLFWRRCATKPDGPKQLNGKKLFKRPGLSALHTTTLRARARLLFVGMMICKRLEQRLPATVLT